MAISELKNGKATGNYQIPAELIKEERWRSSRRSFMILFKKYGMKRSYHERKYGIICPIQKRGDEMICDTNRAVTLLGTTYKILANILYVKLVSYAQEIIEENKGVF
jgi:hypothetical protein